MSLTTLSKQTVRTVVCTVRTYDILVRLYFATVSTVRTHFWSVTVELSITVYDTQYVQYVQHSTVLVSIR